MQKNVLNYNLKKKLITKNTVAYTTACTTVQAVIQ